MSNERNANPGKPEGEAGINMLRRMNDSHRPLREWAFPYISWTPEMKILDVGCGGGAAIADMLTLSENSVINGLDYSADSVALSSETNAAFLGSRVFVTRGDVCDMPYEDGSFDLVTAVETVYFWPRIGDAFSQVYRVLRDGGSFAVLCEADGPDRVNWDNIDFPLKIYYPHELEDLMQNAGFQNIRYFLDGNGYLVIIGEK